MEQHKNYIVTGVSSGIGRSVAQSLLSQDHGVVGLSRQFASGESDNALSDHQNFRFVGCDLGDNASLENAFDQIKSQDKPLHGVVLCHGLGDFGSIEEFSVARIQHLMQVNLVSYLLVSRILMPVFKRQKFGDMVIIGSEAGLRGGKKGVVYSASKHGLQGLVSALREETAASGIRVSIVNPGMVKTPFFENLNFTHGERRENYLQPADVAEAVSFILSLPEGSVVDTINLSPQTKVVRNKTEKS